MPFALLTTRQAAMHGRDRATSRAAFALALLEALALAALLLVDLAGELG